MCLLMLFSLAKVKQVSKKSLECFLFECPLMVALSQSKSRCPVSSKCLYIGEVGNFFLEFSWCSFILNFNSRPVSPTYEAEQSKHLIS